MPKAFWFFCAAIALAAPTPATPAASPKAAGTLHVPVEIEARSYDVAFTRVDVEAAPGAPLFIETTKDDDLSSLALARGMKVATVDLAGIPASARGPALRKATSTLRGLVGAKRLLGHGKGETAAALAEAGAAFDGLLLQDYWPASAIKGPRIIEVWGSDAYWGPANGAALPAPSPAPDHLRRFFIAGAAEIREGANCAAPLNKRSPAPALRALLVALDDWTKGVAPPASRAPGSADLIEAGGLVWPRVAGVTPPGKARLVPKIDADGNETAGLRLPDHALPIATFTGFNAQKDRRGPACVAGAAAPFPSSKADRENSGDPRLSLVERYGSRAYFVATLRVVADKLVKDRLLLKEDADAYVAAAKQAPF